MSSDLMGLLVLLSIGTAGAAQPRLERPPPTPTIQAGKTAVAARPQTSPVRKADMTRRLFWMAMSLR